MIRYASIVLLVLAVAAPVAAQAPDPTLDLFQQTCFDRRRDPAVRIEQIRDLGWSPAAEADHPQLAEVIPASRAAMVDDEGDVTRANLSAWRRELGGRTFFLVLHDVDNPYARVLGCVIYDFAASGPVDPALLNRWLEETPEMVRDEPRSIRSQLWRAWRLEGVLEVNNAWLAPGGQAQSEAGFSGLALSTTTQVE